jgi:hypothetical protein
MEANMKDKSTKERKEKNKGKRMRINKEKIK